MSFNTSHFRVRNFVKVLCAMGWRLSCVTHNHFDAEAERETEKERRHNRRNDEETAMRGKKELKKNELRCLSQSHCKSLQRGSKVKREEWKKKMRIAMRRGINIAPGEARLRCENGLEFARRYYCQAISPVPFRRILHNTNRH